MRFFEYNKGIISERPYPNTSDFPDGKNCFLIYAANEAAAKDAAKNYLAGKPFVTLENFRFRNDVIYKYIHDVAM